MPQRPPQQGLLRLPPVGHPGTLESFVPFIGSGHEALGDYQDGDYPGAVGNGFLALTDAVPIGAAAKGVWKVGRHALKQSNRGQRASYKWPAVRARMVKDGYLKKGEPGHHVFFERNGPIGKWVPDFIKNQEWNIVPTPSAEVHGRIHGRWKGADRYPLLKRLDVGSPTWAKRVVAGAVADGAAAAKAKVDEAKRKKR